MLHDALRRGIDSSLQSVGSPFGVLISRFCCFYGVELQSSADTKSPGLRGARKLLNLSNSFDASSLGAIRGFPTANFPSFTGAGINVGPTTTETTNSNSALFEGAGGSGGGAAFGQGSLTLDLEDVQNFEGSNSGSTTSMGGAFGVVGLDADQGAKFLTDIFGPNAFGVGGNPFGAKP